MITRGVVEKDGALLLVPSPRGLEQVGDEVDKVIFGSVVIPAVVGSVVPGVVSVVHLHDYLVVN